MEKTVYKKIALQMHFDFCPVCNSPIKEKRIVSFIVHGKNKQRNLRKANMPFCDRCGIPSSTGIINEQLNKRALSSVDFLRISKGQSRKEIKKQLVADPMKPDELNSSYYEFVPVQDIRIMDKNWDEFSRHHYSLV